MRKRERKRASQIERVLRPFIIANKTTHPPPAEGLFESKLCVHTPHTYTHTHTNTHTHTRAHIRTYTHTQLCATRNVCFERTHTNKQVTLLLFLYIALDAITRTQITRLCTRTHDHTHNDGMYVYVSIYDYTSCIHTLQ